MADHSLPILCGVDVSLAALDIAQTDQPVTSIPNTLAGITDWLASLPGHARIAVEATGRYHELLHGLATELGWQASIRLCQTIPGVGSLSALALTACFHRGEFKRSDQWVAYMGLDVRVRDSGTCRGWRKLSKRGAILYSRAPIT